MVDTQLFLKNKAAQGLLRRLNPFSSRKDGRICAQGREYVDFSSNDYLGLAQHPEIIAAAREAAERFGASSSASRLLSGDLELHHQLEEEVARFKGKEAALVFNSGYQANLGIISALYAKGDGIFSDRLAHASIIDGILLSGADFFRFRHNDAEHLEILLKKNRRKFKKALIATEAIFSMDGDRCPLKDLVRLKEEYDCQILIDEAHATGVFGREGSGLAEEEGLTGGIDFLMGTFGKALGSFGAYVACSGQVVDYLINASRSFIYSTALPPSVIAANLAAISLIRKEPQRRRNLLKRADYFRQRLKGAGFTVRGSSQIVPLITQDSQKAISFSERLKEQGYWALPIRPPAVPANESRLRFSLTHYHNEEVLEGLINGISKIRV